MVKTTAEKNFVFGITEAEMCNSVGSSNSRAAGTFKHLSFAVQHTHL